MAVEILWVEIDELAHRVYNMKSAGTKGRTMGNTLNTCDCRARGTTVRSVQKKDENLKTEEQ